MALVNNPLVATNIDYYLISTRLKRYEHNKLNCSTFMELQLINCSVKIFFYCSITWINLVINQSLFAHDTLEFDAVYTADYLQNVDGGVSRSGSYLDNLDLFLDFDTEALWNIENSKIHLQVIYNNNNTFSDIVGDAQVTSNIDNSRMIRVYELWFEKNTIQHSFKFGLYDLNSEFDAIETASIFLNSSHGIAIDYSQSGESGPSIFPATALAVRYAYQFNQDFQLRVALIDAIPGATNDPTANTIKIGGNDGYLFALETNYILQKTRIAVGSWLYSRSTDTLSRIRRKRNRGTYGLVEQTFINSTNGKVDLKGWLRYGQANKLVNQFGQYFGTGLVLSQFIGSRSHDSLGVAIAVAMNSHLFRNLNPDSNHRETTLELTYRYVVNSHLVIQPDIQYVFNPSTEPSLENALVLGIRFEYSLQ